MEKIAPNTFAAVIHAYLASAKFAELSESTKEGYRTYLREAERPDLLGKLQVAILRPALIQRFLDRFAKRPGAQQRAKVALCAVERWALVRDYLPHPITTGTEINRSDGGHKPWTDTQVAIAEAHARETISRLITLAANTGQRGSDLVRMRWSDIEKVDGHIGINVVQKKTGIELWIPFTEPLKAAIATWERRPGFILTSTDGGPWASRRSVYVAWVRERDGNPLLAPCAELVLHGLRATAVIRLRRAGAAPGQIADMVGMSIRTVEHYCRHADQKTSALAAVHFLNRGIGERPGNKQTS